MLRRGWRGRGGRKGSRGGEWTDSLLGGGFRESWGGRVIVVVVVLMYVAFLVVVRTRSFGLSPQALLCTVDVWCLKALI